MGSFKASRARLSSLTVPAGASGRTVSLGSFHIYTCDLDIRYADSTDNTIIAQLPNFKIPAHGMVTRIYANVKTLSDLATMNVNIHISAISDQTVDAGIDGGGEVLGASAPPSALTGSSNGTAPSDMDITMGASANDLKESWFNNDTWNIGALGITNDIYVYVCNAGTGNGTTNPTAGTLSIIVEYYGND